MIMSSCDGWLYDTGLQCISAHIRSNFPVVLICHAFRLILV